MELFNFLFNILFAVGLVVFCVMLAILIYSEWAHTKIRQKLEKWFNENLEEDE